MSLHGQIVEGVKPVFPTSMGKGKRPVRWGRNWRLRIRDARVLIVRAKKLGPDRNVLRRHKLYVRAARLVEGVAAHTPYEGHAAQWLAIGRLRGQLVELVETCLGCAASENVPCRIRVHLSARATRALFDLTMREGDRKLAKVAKGVMVNVDEDEIIGELLVREAKRLGPRPRAKRGKQS